MWKGPFMKAENKFRPPDKTKKVIKPLAELTLSQVHEKKRKKNFTVANFLSPI